EDFDAAVRSFDLTLDVVPAHAEALLGKARAMTYLGQHAAAISAADRLLAVGQWYLGDARYWRAFNEMQLGQLDAAWDDVEKAQTLLVNAEVPKLAGIIAYRRRQIDVARAQFQESNKRDRQDCETSLYLGIVLSEARTWSGAVDVFTRTVACL